MPNVLTQYPMAGGLDEANPPMLLAPGRLLDVANYEIGNLGYGYTRIKGYERFDGRPVPSETTYATQVFDAGTTEPAVGTLVYNNRLDPDLADPSTPVTGRFVVTVVTVTSGAWATNDAAGSLELAVISGAFADNDAIVHPWDAGISYATADGATSFVQETDSDDHSARTAVVREAMRSEIREVPGALRVYGCSSYKTNIHAFRDANIIAYSAGNGDIPQLPTVVEGVTSGAIGTLNGFTVTSGTPSAGTAVGYFALTVTSGTFQAAETLKNQATNDVFATINTLDGTKSAMWKSSLDSWELVEPDTWRSAVSSSDRIMEFITYNFTGAAGTEKMYGVDGVGKAFEWDGTTFKTITTGMAADTPKHVAARRNALYLSFDGGSVQHSSPVADPTAGGSWTPVLGAAELAVGDEVTGMVVIRNDALLVMSKDSAKLIVGTPGVDESIIDYSNDLGAIEWSLQNVGVPMFLDDEGLVLFSASDVSGGWNRDTVSQLVNKSLLPKRNIVTCSITSRSRNIYRLFFSDASAYSVAINGNFSAGVGAVSGISKLRFQHVVRTATASHDVTGPETIHFASDDGYVRQMDSGTSFDGAAFFYQLKTAYDYQAERKDAYTRATYRNVRFQMDAKSTDVSLTLRPSYDWGVPSKAESIPITFEPEGRLGFILGSTEQGVLGEDTLGGTSVPIAKANIAQGGGVSLGLYIYATSAEEDQHTFFGVLTEWSPEGREQYR